MNKTLIFLKRETSLSAEKAPVNTTAFSGFLLRLSTEAYNISPKVFVMQRDVSSNYVDNISDHFYSIASVAEMEFIPEDAPDVNNTNFYRTDKVDLVFETPKELEDGYQKIRFEVSALAIANDDTYTVTHESWEPFPSDAIQRYYGVSQYILTTNQIKDALFSDSTYSSSLNFSADITDIPQYIYFVLHRNLGETHTIKMDSIELPLTSSEIVLDTTYGLSQPYRVFRTTNKHQSDGICHCVVI